jgi:4-hydroxy-2-oxoheptanedioate aldolase
MKNNMKERIENGQKTVGSFFESGSTSIAECMALGELDYIIIDAEHGPFEAESVMEFVCACQRRNMTPFVRVKDSSRAAILKMLDVGAMGLIIPNVKSVEEVRRIVSYSKYFPLGNRGVAFGRGSGFGFAEPKSLEEYFVDANENTLIIPQCETKECLEQVEQVIAVDGIAGLFVGPYDLSSSLGKPGQFDDPEIKQAIARIVKACHDAGKFAMIYADNGASANMRFSQGFDSVTINMDTILFIRMLKQLKEEALGSFR